MLIAAVIFSFCISDPVDISKERCRKLLRHANDPAVHLTLRKGEFVTFTHNAFGVHANGRCTYYAFGREGMLTADGPGTRCHVFAFRFSSKEAVHAR